MKQVLLVAALVVIAGNAYAQTPPVRTFQTNDVEIDFQKRLNSLACKSVGQDDGGQVCDAAKFLNSKLDEAKKPKPEPEPKKDP